MRKPRPVDVARLALGTVLVARPDLPLRLSEAREGRWVLPVVRALGVRYAGQALAGAVVRRPWVPTADAGVDLVHAASMVALAVVSPPHRRLATASAATAIVFASADLRGTRQLPEAARR